MFSGVLCERQSLLQYSICTDSTSMRILLLFIPFSFSLSLSLSLSLSRFLSSAKFVRYRVSLFLGWRYRLQTSYAWLAFKHIAKYRNRYFRRKTRRNHNLFNLIRIFDDNRQTLLLLLFLRNILIYNYITDIATSMSYKY